MRNPLDKQTFFSGIRQKWFGILLAILMIILFADVKADIDPSSYLNFLIVGGSVFLLGQSVDSALKIKAKSGDIKPNIEE